MVTQFMVTRHRERECGNIHMLHNYLERDQSVRVYAWIFIRLVFPLQDVTSDRDVRAYILKQDEYDEDQDIDHAPSNKWKFYESYFAFCSKGCE